MAAAVAIAALGWLGGVRGAINGAIGSLLLAALMRAPADRADAAAALVIAALGLAAATMGAGSLALFRSNRFTGLLLFLGFLVVGLSSLD